MHDDSTPLGMEKDETAMKENLSEKPRTLREEAESLLQAAELTSAIPHPDSSPQLVHELQVHQIELELQNEELRKSQTALEESRARYMHLYHNAPVGYVILNTAGIITQDNATFAKMVGRHQSQLQGKAFADFLVPDDQPIFRARLRAFFRHPDDKHIEVRIGTRENTCLYVDLAASPQMPDNQATEPHAQELLVTVTDITARAKAEEALHRSRGFVMAVINALSSHVCVLNAQGEIIAVNEAWRKFAAANPPVPGNISEGANYLAICGCAEGEEKETAHIFAEGIRAVLRGEIPLFSMESPCHSDAEQRWFVGRVTRLADDSGYHAVVAHEDITERKLLEKEQMQLQTQINQLEKAESLGRMAGAIAHNFNNMLTVVLGNLEMALDDMPDQKGSISLKAALQAAWRASEMSGLMLTYLGQTVEVKEQHDLSYICNHGLPRLMLAKPAECQIHTSFPSPGPVVTASAKLIQQMFSNLMANAWESLEEQTGSIEAAIYTVAARQISSVHRFPLDWQARDDIRYACLEVRDSGIGIVDRDLKKLFDPFFSSKFTGRGMGLSVVLGILRAHDGAVTVESRPGQGSVFRIYLPCSSPSFQPASQ